MASDLTKRLLKNIKINHGASILSESTNFDIPKDSYIDSGIPMLNVALSGDVQLGMAYGVTMFAGPSKHFKTSYGLTLAKAFQDKYTEGVVLYLDSEHGGVEYLDKFGIDRERVVHVPVLNVEELKFNVVNILEEWNKDDKLFIFCDSLGNLASKKEVEDAINEKSVADMTRAKQMKSLFRIITPIINMKHIYSYWVQHTYKSQDFMPIDVVAGGTGAMYSANNVFIIGRSQEKEKSDLSGFNFKIKVEKSRYIKEKSVIDIIASFEDGILPYSGLADNAVEFGIIEKIRSKGNIYKYGDLTVQEKDINKSCSKEFWDEVFSKSDFREYLLKKYKM